MVLELADFSVKIAISLRPYSLVLLTWLLGMSQGDYKGGQFGAHGYIIRGKAARILPGEGFEAKIRALGFLVLGNLGYSLY